MKNNVHACLTLLEHGSMRFNWETENTNRTDFFETLLSPEKKLVPVQLIHSKTVLAVNTETDTHNVLADGIITCNKNLVPVVTVADCMPIFLFEPNTGCFGVLHSGWKGTGIVIEALKLAKETYHAKEQDFHVIIGPHIKKCCYTIDRERAEFFKTEIDPCCVEKIDANKYSLSLEKANLFLLEKAGVKKERITVIGSCTNCSTNDEKHAQYGSFRRETNHLPENTPLQERLKNFTPMAAFAYWGDPTSTMNDAHILIHKM